MAELVDCLFEDAYAKESRILGKTIKGLPQPRQSDEGLVPAQGSLAKDKVEPWSVTVGVGQTQYTLGWAVRDGGQYVYECRRQHLAATRVVSVRGQRNLVAYHDIVPKYITDLVCHP